MRAFFVVRGSRWCRIHYSGNQLRTLFTIRVREHLTTKRHFIRQHDSAILLRHDCLDYMGESMSLLPKALHLPPPGRPRWVCPESAQLDLLYLAWGHRQYGQNPIPVSRHPGWHYVLVNRGKPTLILENEQKSFESGRFSGDRSGLRQRLDG